MIYRPCFSENLNTTEVHLQAFGELEGVGSGRQQMPSIEVTWGIRWPVIYRY
ncbi:MAG: hypothetical protein ACI9YH_000606 [Colwellia sp.]|jgi:hypothetical protein